MARTSKVRSAALKHGWRSGLEEAVGEQLRRAGVNAPYEPGAITYLQPAKPRKYTPDFILPNGIVVETKGRFVTADRQKMLMVRDSNPDLEIRFVFSNSRSRISKQSATTYALWCERKGFTYADKEVPASWLREKTHRRSLAALEKLGLI